MTKIVYNACYGGFGLSDEAIERYAELKGITIYKNNKREFGISHYYRCPVEDYLRIQDECNESGDHSKSNGLYYYPDYDRADPILVQVVEELGDAANRSCADLQIEEVPAGTLYRIDEYDGKESVMTQRDYDWKVA